jgi:hypothetical protein
MIRTFKILKRESNRRYSTSDLLPHQLFHLVPSPIVEILVKIIFVRKLRKTLLC